MTYRCLRRRLAVVMVAAAATLGACTVKRPVASAAKLAARGGPLLAKVGAKVSWSFAALVPTDNLAVIDVVADPAPFGAKVLGTPGKDLRIEGEVLGSEFRFGYIDVTFRDVGACKAKAAAALALAVRNAADSGAKTGVASAVDCDDVRVSRADTDRRERFIWRMAGTPDDDTGKAHAAIVALADCTIDAHCGAEEKAAGIPPPRRVDQLLQSQIAGRTTFVRLATDDWLSGGALPTLDCAADTLTACTALGNRCLWNLGHCMQRRRFP